jgi:hypothetical protein
VTDRPHNFADALPVLLDELLRNFLPASRLTDRDNVLFDFGEGTGCQPEDIGRSRHLA